MDDLITNNLNLVKFVINKMNLYDINNYDDYFQVGVIGLISASKSYKKDSQISFSTYAYVCIKNEILKYIKKNDSNDISLEKEVCEDITIKDIIKDENINIIDSITLKETNIELYNLLKENLNELEYKIIKMSYGIGCREYKQREISEMLNIPQYQISRIKNRLLVRLRKIMKEYI